MFYILAQTVHLGTFFAHASVPACRGWKGVHHLLRSRSEKIPWEDLWPYPSWLGDYHAGCFQRRYCHRAQVFLPVQMQRTKTPQCYFVCQRASQQSQSAHAMLRIIILSLPMTLTMHRVRLLIVWRHICLLVCFGGSCTSLGIGADATEVTYYSLIYFAVSWTEHRLKCCKRAVARFMYGRMLAHVGSPRKVGLEVYKSFVTLLL